MRVSYFIAKRYLFSKKNLNIINIITGVSVVGVAVCTMSLIVILSVFNGFESLVKTLYNSFNPDISITAKIGKTFTLTQHDLDKIKNIKGVKYIGEIIEENALLKYGDKQVVATIKGVDNSFLSRTRLDTMLADGSYVLERGAGSLCVVGQGIAYNLQLNLNDVFRNIKVFAPRRNADINSPIAEEYFNEEVLMPSGVFAVQQEFDSKYVIVPINFARKVFEYPTQLTSLDITLQPNVEAVLVQQQIVNILGNKFTVRDRYQQEVMLYNIMKTEKWAIFFILIFILLLSAFNALGSLIIIIADKRKDIKTLRSIGADNKLIRQIFLTEGMLASVLGMFSGLILGILLCVLQLKFGFIKLGENFVIKSYPVDIRMSDILIVAASVLAISFITNLIPMRSISKKHLRQKD